MVKSHRQERIAAVYLDEKASSLLNTLYCETSIRWSDLPDKTNGEWSAICRAVALLTSADLCLADINRIRISEYGEELVAASGGKGNDRLSEILKVILDEQAPPPSIVPTWVGGIQAEWHHNGIDLEIEVSPNGNVEYFFKSPDTEYEGFGKYTAL